MKGRYSYPKTDTEEGTIATTYAMDRIRQIRYVEGITDERRVYEWPRDGDQEREEEDVNACFTCIPSSLQAGRKASRHSHSYPTTPAADFDHFTRQPPLRLHLRPHLI